MPSSSRGSPYPRYLKRLETQPVKYPVTQAFEATAQKGSGIRSRHGTQVFEHPALTGYSWPTLEIESHRAGPRVCVMAGVHVNEVAGIEAALRLAETLPSRLCCGNVSVLPLVNLPALPMRAEYNCPIDEKNLNWRFPGCADGSFTEQLADALLNVWAADAAVLIDLHGGDLRETIATFVMYQETSNDELNAANRKIAECFDTQFVEPLRPALMEQSGRACTGRGTQSRLAVMSEAGGNGLVDPEAVTFHHDGVLRVLDTLDMLAGPPPPLSQRPVYVRDRIGVEAPADGLMRAYVDVGDTVEKDAIVADIRNYHGCVIRQIRAPATGIVLFKITHPVVNQGERIMSFASRSET